MSEHPFKIGDVVQINAKGLLNYPPSSRVEEFVFTVAELRMDIWNGGSIFKAYKTLPRNDRPDQYWFWSKHFELVSTPW